MRSGLIATSLTLGAATAWADERVWQFRVLLDGDEVGTHSFRVSEDPARGAREVRSEAQFTVRFLFVNAYRYAHEAREQWQGDCLARIEARTDDNGDILTVRGERRENGFAVEGPKGRDLYANCVMSFAYWNPRMLRQTRLLNSQTGLWQDVRIDARGEETLAVRGTPIKTRRYALRGEDLQIDLWYTDADDWVQLESRVAGGRTLRYQRL
ncbi:hypothetical protein AZ34_07545 [Hylemonella gracilis str. Niagara R]|uniref:DUF3108 domain-containing protein n=1 Tax=Hylemonella gracilis str. Niagara R TaxID=1458275 RepID=A0A016XFR5_9BURK|nr:hypothetical protein AZ34_07545 [Hylemonella gracilis str. Niagara R]